MVRSVEQIILISVQYLVYYYPRQIRKEKFYDANHKNIYITELRKQFIFLPFSYADTTLNL